MTKVNENGQLEWTFEELNLVEEVLKLSEEFNKLSHACDYLAEILDTCEIGSEKYEIIRYEFSKAHKKQQLVYKIKWLIIETLLTKEEKTQWINGGK